MDAYFELARGNRTEKNDDSGKRIRDAKKMLAMFQKLKEQHKRTGNPEEDAEALFIEQKIQEYSEDLSQIRS